MFFNSSRMPVKRKDHDKEYTLSCWDPFSNIDFPKSPIMSSTEFVIAKTWKLVDSSMQGIGYGLRSSVRSVSPIWCRSWVCCLSSGHPKSSIPNHSGLGQLHPWPAFSLSLVSWILSLFVHGWCWAEHLGRSSVVSSSNRCCAALTEPTGQLHILGNYVSTKIHLYRLVEHSSRTVDSFFQSFHLAIDLLSKFLISLCQ